MTVSIHVPKVVANALRRMSEGAIALVLFLIIASVVGLIAALTFLFGRVVLEAVGIGIIMTLVSLMVYIICEFVAVEIKRKLNQKETDG